MRTVLVLGYWRSDCSDFGVRDNARGENRVLGGILLAAQRRASGVSTGGQGPPADT